MRVLTSLAVMSLSLGAGAAETPELVGSYVGGLQISGLPAPLRLIFRIKNTGGALSATLESPDQGPGELAADSVSGGDDVHIEWKRIHARFDGKLGKIGLAGSFTQNGATHPLELARTDAVKRCRPQTPSRPLPYDETEVKIPSVPGVVLAGTLTTPPKPGPFPVALLVTGSGPQDRDETIFEHRSFFVIADALTRRGVAVLRLDDRGIGASTGSFAGATSDDFLADAKAALAWLRKQPNIDARRTGIIGHSEGGMIAALIAGDDPELAFCVLLAGSAFPGADILEQQVVAIARADGVSEVEVQLRLAAQRRVNAILRDGGSNADIERKLRELLGSGPDGDAKIRGVMSPWFRRFLVLDPRPSLARSRCPILALNGSRDVQVVAKDNLPAIAKAAAHNKDVTVAELPGLNHLFQTAKTGSPVEYASIEETFAPAALSRLVDWVVARTAKK